MTELDEKAEQLVVYMETTNHPDAAKIRELVEAIFILSYAGKPFYVRWWARCKALRRAYWQTFLDRYGANP